MEMLFLTELEFEAQLEGGGWLEPIFTIPNPLSKTRFSTNCSMTNSKYIVIKSYEI